jgi:hypothetical protein
VLKYRAPHGSQPRHGWAPDPQMVGIRSPMGLVVGSCTSHPGVLGSIPNREEPGKTVAPCVKVPGSSRVPAPPWVNRSPDGWDQIPYLCDFVTVDCVVTWSSTRAKNRFKEMTGYVGCHGKVSQALPYPEPLRVTGPLQSLVLRAEDMWRKYKPFFIEVFGILNPGFPCSSLQCRQGMTPT